MLSKRSPPPRPPMPRRKTDGTSKSVEQPEDQNAAKKLDFFSIRYSREDNESDEEISIVRKEDSVEEEDLSVNEDLSGADVSEPEKTDQTVQTKETNATSSILSSISIPFLSRSPSKNSVDSLSMEDKLKPPNSDELNDGKGSERNDAEVRVVVSGEANGECGQAGFSNGAEGQPPESPPKRRNERLTSAVVSHAMSLSSLLKKEVEQIQNFGRGSHHDASKTKESALSKAVKNSSMFLMPLGMNSTESDQENQQNKKARTIQQHTDVPIYNILIVSSIVFLYHMLPTSSFLNGFVFGGFLTFFLVCALMWLLTPEMTDQEKYKRDLLEHKIEIEDLEFRKDTRKCVEPCKLSKPQDLESWFFKTASYVHNPSDPVDFNDREHVLPVFVELSGNIMTFNIPKKDELSKIKRSSMLEPNLNIKFSSTKEYDLRYGGEIELVPETMTLKRIWAKKYPIYLKIFERPVLSVSEEGERAENFELPTVTEEMYLFSPTNRGKEEWYYRMEKLLKPRTHQQHGTSEIESIFNPRSSFPYYMAQLIGAVSEPSSQAQLTWVNAFLGRLFWDVWRSEHWNTKVRNRIQNKISRMKLPPFIRYLKVTDMRLGNALPTIQRAHNLLQDNRGIWVDLDVDYQGGIMLTIETMVNLEYYLKQLTDQGKNEGEEVVLRFSRDESGYSDDSSSGSDADETEEDWSEASEGIAQSILSPESLSGSGENSSSETEVDGDRQSVGSSSEQSSLEQDNQGWAGRVKNPKGKKILNMLEKVAKSKWVQKAAETKVVQRAVEKFSNLPIVLGVEVVRLRGTLAANIPPPPSNRLWLGFHSSPLLSLIARPKLGERHVRLTHVTEWIEYKLKQEFKSMFVLPNMEDLTIRIMDSGLEEKFDIS